MQKENKLSVGEYEHRDRGQHQGIKMKRSPKLSNQWEVPYVEVNLDLCI